MQRAKLELFPGLWLDARRAVWLEEQRTLLVADLHLGYAWAHRQRGNLMPIRAGEDTIDRLHALAVEYAPREIVVLGDVIHAATTADALLVALQRLHTLSDGTAVKLIAGNHDAKLAELLRRAGVNSELLREYEVGEHLLVHGDGLDEAAAEACCGKVRARGGRVLLGHEHPAISISDGVATSARCPCFLVGEEVLVLPAFSPWAAGSNVRHGNFLSPYVRRARLTGAIAIVSGKLLPMPLQTPRSS